MNPSDSLHKGKGVNLLNQRLKEKRSNSPAPKRPFSPNSSSPGVQSPTVVVTTTTTAITTSTTTTTTTAATTTATTTNEDLVSNEILSGLDLASVQQKIDLSSKKQKQRTISALPTMETNPTVVIPSQNPSNAKPATNIQQTVGEQNYVAVRTTQKLNQIATQKYQINILLLGLHTLLWFLFFSLSIILVTGLALVLILIAQKGVL